MPFTLIPNALQSHLMYSRSIAVSLAPIWKSSKAQQSEVQTSLISCSTTSQIQVPGKQKSSLEKSVMSTDGGLHPLQQFPTCVPCLPPAESDFNFSSLTVLLYSAYPTQDNSCIQDHLLIPQTPLQPWAFRVHSGLQFESRPLVLQGKLFHLVLGALPWHITPLWSPAMLIPVEILTSAQPFTKMLHRLLHCGCTLLT